MATCSRSRAARRRFTALLLPLALGLAGALPCRAAWEPIPAEAWKEPARPDSGGADAIVLLESTECRQKESGFEVDYFARARVFTAEGRGIADVEIPYVKKQWKLESLRARSVRPNGDTVELDPTTVVTTTSWEFREFEVLKASVAIPGVEPGCIVEWGYTLTGPKSIGNGWRFHFWNDYYNCRSTHAWIVPDGIWPGARPSVRYANILPSRVEESFEPSRERPRTVRFTARGLAGARSEALAPPTLDAGPWVAVHRQRSDAEPTTHWSAWKRVFDLYQEAVVKTPGRLDELVKGFRAGAADDLGALRAAFRWLQSNMVSNEELSWARRPDAEKIQKQYRFAENLKDLLERREASPFEINVAMVAFARKLGFVASVGLVGDREFERFDSRVMGFPPQKVITVVWPTDDLLFLQPSSRFAVFGSIPWELRGGECLLSGTNTHLVGRIPADAGAPAREVWTLAIDLAVDGELSGRISARLEAEACAEWRRDLWDEDPARWQAVIEERLADDGGPMAKADPVALGAPGDTAFALEAAARWPSVATADGDRIEVPVERLAPWRTHARFLFAHRTRPVLLRNARDETLRLRLRLPPGMTVDHLPAASRFDGEIGHWSQAWSLDGGQVSLERRVVLERAELPIKSYPQVREFFDSLERADRAVLLVVKAK